MKEIKGQSVVLVGYGREGQSTHKYLLENYPSIRIGISDQKPVEPIHGTQAELHTGSNYLDNLHSYDTAVRSPSIPTNASELQKFRELGKWTTTETNIFFSECPGTIIGITGTKGKSTTASLIYEVIRSQYDDTRLVGNIGKPALDSLPGATASTIFVTELSSYQLEDIRYSPHIAVVLAITPEHIDYHGDFETYITAKGNIIRHQTEQDIVVFNPNHETAADMALASKSQKFCFSPEKDPDIRCYVDKEKVCVVEENGKTGVIMSVEEIPLMGQGNLENTLAAVSVAFLLGISPKKIREAILKFKSLPNRLEFVGERSGIRFYNDSLATTPEAVIHALEALGEEVETLIAGGYDRGLNFSILARFLSQRKLKNLILFPDTGEKIWQAILDHVDKKDLPQKYEVASMEEAARIALGKTTPGKICLLSPGSASFNLFQDYEDRGNQFKKYIAED